jgi:TetR/AcrR family transcriptional regulator, lmrAB and yxaGH operons repressor
MAGSQSRRKMIQSAAVLMQQHGVEATSFRQVLEHSGAPRGSIYFHFPDGKAQLVTEATRYAGEFIAAGLVTALEQDDLATALDTFVATWRSILEQSDFAAGCPVVAAALEGARMADAVDVAGAAFTSWERQISDVLERRGVDPDRAASLATISIAAIEGAVVLGRAQRSSTPLTRVTAELRHLIATVDGAA